MTITDCTDCYAVPGEDHIIDTIDPTTGLTWIQQQTEAEVQARYPGAVRMTLDAFCHAKAARQHTPVVWESSTAEQYQEMLEVLPPAYWHDGVFCVGEPSDHDASTGRPRFATYRQIGDTYQVASRPMTIAEVKAGSC